MAAPIPASESTLSKLTEQIKNQNAKLSTLVGQGEAQIEAAEDSARSAAEAAREAARKGKEEDPEIAVKLEVEDKGPGIFKAMTLSSLIKTFGGWIFSGLSTAFAWLGKMLGGPKLVAVLGKLAGPAALIAGLALAIKDGLAGWVSSEEWGVSKISGFLGGFFGGDADGGIKNAFTNAGKWALIGAGIGSVVPVVGTIVGGLVGAAIGGILGFIGGKAIAKSFDNIGVWFKKQFDTLILGPIKAVWDFIAPSWAKQVTDKMEWSDLLPPGLNKLFNGEYFTFDFPKFSWIDLFPKFLVDLFNNVAVASKEADFKWTDLMPKFLVKFFKGEYSKEGSFQWSDLLPEFITKIIGVAKTAWADTDFTWRSLVPNFILKIVDGFTQTGEFQWSDLVPKFISDLVAAGTAEATKTGEFSWKALLPDWMVGAWDSTVGLAKQTYFGWKNLMPDWLQPYITTAEGQVSKALGEVGSWDWKSLLPKFIQDFIADPTQLAGEEYKFDWKDLLPQFIRDFFGDKKIDESLNKALDPKWWIGLLPDWMGKIIGGESGDAITGEQASVMDKIGAIFSGIGERIKESFTGIIDSIADSIPDLNPFSDTKPSKMTKEERSEEITELEAKLKAEMAKPKEGGLFTDVQDVEDVAEMQKRLASLRKFATGGPVNLTGPAHLTAGEMVLDNNAARLFVKAASILSGQNLMDLQRASATAGGVGATMIVNNTNSQQINQSQAMVLPPSPIIPGNGESTLSDS